MSSRRPALSSTLLLLAPVLLGCGDPEEPGLFTRIDFSLPHPVAGASDAKWGDYDNDGDLDVAVAAIISPGMATWILRNDGNGSFAYVDPGFVDVAAGALAWADCDSDGDLDLLVCGLNESMVYETRLYRNEGGDTFVDSGASLPEQVLAEAGDVDNDGDLDLVGSGRVYENNGDGTFTERDPGIGIRRWFADYDRDGDLDVTVREPIGYAIYRNDGGLVFSSTGIEFPPRLESSGLLWCDFDNDGLLDLTVYGWDLSAPACVTKVYRNCGGGVFSWTGQEMPPYDHSALAWGDFNNDGFPDFVLSGDYFEPHTCMFKSIPSGTYVRELVEVFDEPTEFDSLAWGDYDNDGDLDLLFAGSYDKWTMGVLRNNSTVRNTPPSAPAALWSEVVGNSVTFHWSVADDDETPSAGLTYNLKVHSESGGDDDVMPCHSDPATGKRRIPAMGNVQHNTSWTLKGLSTGIYYWSVQTIDTAFEGSPWAPEQTFAVP